MSSKVYTLLDRINDKFTLYREDKATSPKYLILGPEYRQAIKVEARASGAPFNTAEVAKYMGIPIIPYEDVVVLYKLQFGIHKCEGCGMEYGGRTLPAVCPMCGECFK